MDKNPFILQTDAKQQLLAQQRALKEQDESLEELSLSIKRLKEISHQIGSKLETQNKLIDSVQNDVEATTGKVVATTKKIKEVHHKTKSGCMIS